MPIVSRKLLRQRLGLNQLHDTYVGTHVGSLPANAGSAWFMDPTISDLSATADMLYNRAWAKTQGMTFRVASFNAASGAFISLQFTATTVLSGSEYEVHELLSPDDKDRAIDWAVNRYWTRQEIAINTVDGDKTYSVGFEFGQIFDWWAYANPSSSLDRMRTDFMGKPDVVLTGSGRELRIPWALAGSQQIVLDAAVRATLGSADAATINIPSEQLILYGAESQCWEMIAKRAPAQERKAYLLNAQRAAGAYSRLASRFVPQTDKRIGFETLV